MKIQTTNVISKREKEHGGPGSCTVLLTLVEYQFWISKSFAAGTVFRAQTGRANTLTVKKMTSQRSQA